MIVVSIVRGELASSYLHHLGLPSNIVDILLIARNESVGRHYAFHGSCESLETFLVDESLDVCHVGTHAPILRRLVRQ